MPFKRTWPPDATSPRSHAIQESGRWLFLVVDAQPPVVAGSWEQIAPQVELDLRARAVEELEIAQWRSAMQARYEVDFQPFLRLVGQIPR